MTSTQTRGAPNFSGASITANDENMLVIRGDTRVADIYLTEFMRLFTHMRCRATMRKSHDERAPAPGDSKVVAPLTLDPSDAWAEPYFDPGDPKFKERVLFSGSSR